MINIIGGAGFIGKQLSRVLTVDNILHEVFDCDLNDRNYADVTIPESLKALPPAKVLINLAAEHRDDVKPKSRYRDVNVVGAENICNYCRDTDTKTIIFTSSVAVYGFAPEETDETGELKPFNEYGKTKLEAEDVYKRWQDEDRLHRCLVIIRPTVVFGEGNRGNVFNLLNAIARRRFIMFGHGKNRKSLAYVNNLASFLAFCVDFGPGVHLYNYVDKPDFDMNTLVGHCKSQLFGHNRVGARIPAGIGLLIGHIADAIAVATGRELPISSIRIKKFLKSTCFDSSANKTGFVPPVSLVEGLKETIDSEFLSKGQ